MNMLIIGLIHETKKLSLSIHTNSGFKFLGKFLYLTQPSSHRRIQNGCLYYENTHLHYD